MPRLLRPSIRAAAVIVLATAAAACQPEPEERAGGAAVDTAAVMSSLDSMRTVFEEAVEAGDYETQGSVYTSDALFSAPMTPLARGRDSITAVQRRTTPPGATLVIEPIEERILSPDWVYEYGTATLTFTPEGADGPVEMGSTYFVLFQRTPDGWKIHREALSADGPPPGMP